MGTPRQFQILVRRKIPFLSEGIWAVVAVLFLIMLILYIFMLPTKYTSDEMATAYFILAVPDWLKKLSAIAFIGLIICVPFYFSARLKKPALLTFSGDAISIKGKQLELAIPLKNVKRIYFNDLKNLLRQPKNKMQIVIQEKGDKLTTFFLANYEEGELALDTFGQLNTVEFAFYDDNMATMHDDE